MAKRLPIGMRLRGRTYYAWFKANGRSVRKALSTDLRTATRLLNELRTRADKEDFGLIDNGYAWEALKGEFLTWAKQSIRNPDEYERDLRFFERFRAVHAIREVDHALVIGYRSWRLDAGVCPRTVNREVGTVHNMLGKAVEWKRIGANPLAGLKPLRHDTPSKERRALFVDEIERLFAASPEYLRPVWHMFAVTGIRRGELSSMLFNDVDFERKTVIVRAGTAKNHKAREIPLDESMLAILVEMKAAAKHRQPVPGNTPAATDLQRERFSRDHVFVTQANTPWGGNLLKRFYSVCRKADIQGAEPGGSVDIHSLRVTFTTMSMDHGANPKAVQAILGHSTLAMTMGVYAKATDQSKRNAINALPFAVLTAPDHVISVEGNKAGTSAGEDPQTSDVIRLA